MMFHRHPHFASAPLVGTGPVGYQGPGDIASGATAWWGLRAYTSASIGNNAIRIVAQDATTLDCPTVAGGGLNISAINTFITAHGAPAYASILYDQTGHGNHLAQSGGNTFAVTGNGLTVPNIKLVFASNQFFISQTANSFTQAQPLSMSVVAYHTSGTGSNAHFINLGASFNCGIIFNGATLGEIYSFAGGSANQATGITESAWHSLQATFTNLTTNVLVIDNAITTGTNAGPNAASGVNAEIGAAGATASFDGVFAEAGVWPGDLAGSLSAIYANQHSYYGVF